MKKKCYFSEILFTSIILEGLLKPLYGWILLPVKTGVVIIICLC